MGDFQEEDRNFGVRSIAGLLRRLGEEKTQTPVLAYPKYENDTVTYEHFTGADLDRLSNGAANALIKMGIVAKNKHTSGQRIALFGLADLNWIITFFGLIKLGYDPLLLSPRLSLPACLSLIDKIDVGGVIYSHHTSKIASEIQQEKPSIQLFPFLSREDYDVHSENPKANDVPEAAGDFDVSGTTFHIHSSGTTGIPKPISFNHRSFLGIMAFAIDKRQFLTAPAFHAYGLLIMLHCLWVRKTCYLFDAAVPQTQDTIIAALTAAKPESICTVPYVLKLLAEKEEALDIMAACHHVMFAGSPCPDELGNFLTSRGIRLTTMISATEVFVGFTNVNRPRDDKDWNFVSVPPHIIPFVYWKPVGNNMFECVVLDGIPAKNLSNSMDPPNSYHTADLYIPHPTKQNRWKFMGRADDRITLTNGEKVLPVAIEGRIRQDPLIKEPVVFGNSREIPGLLVLKAEAARDMDDTEYINRIWPTIEKANAEAESFSQITKEMIAILPPDTPFPVTDKSSVKRAQVYREFSSVIDDLYAKFESVSAQGELSLSPPELEEWIMRTMEENLSVALPDVHTDFYQAGVDSLKALQMRRLIGKTLSLGPNPEKCGEMVVLDCGNATRLAQFLYGLRTGDQVHNEQEAGMALMKDMISKYSHFKKWDGAVGTPPTRKVVLMTGATGFLGAHLLAALRASSDVEKIVCLVRADSVPTARQRVFDALKVQQLPLPPADDPAIFAYPGDVTRSDLGLPENVLQDLRQHLTHIIHVAWPVNFAISLKSFEPQLQGLANLVSLSLSVKTNSPAHLLFCSSIGVASSTRNATVPEALIEDFSQCAPTGYGRSKLVGEYMLRAASEEAGAHVTNLRIGQIIPSKDKSHSKLWNPNEMLPLMVRFGAISGALPAETPGDLACSWIPVDILSKAILELAHISTPNYSPETNNASSEKTSGQLVYNLVHPHPFSWSDDFLPALRAGGLQFETVSWQDWLARLENSNDDNSTEEDLRKNPSRKLLNYWKTDATDPGQAADHLGSTEKNQEVVYETKAAVRDTMSLKNPELAIDDEYVKGLVAAWKKAWEL